MKKIIISLFAFAFISTAMVSVAHASTGSVSFNNDSQDLQTVTVSDYNTSPCAAGPANGCWKSSVTANPGDLVSVQIYFHNTGDATSTDTAIGMSPQNTGNGTAHTFTGGVAGGTDTSGNVVVKGSATIYTPDNESLSFIPGSVRLYRNQSTVGYSVNSEQSLFTSAGENIGDVPAGWSGQGVLVADFRVSGSNNNNNNNYCYINSFTVGNGSNSITINQGNTAMLSWNTTGASSVYISNVGSFSGGVNSTSVSPSVSTSYTLSLSGNNCSGQQTVYVNVNQNNYQPPVYNNQQPQAITTVASVLGPYSAVLNGIAVPNTYYGQTNAWFEYGATTGLGNRTTAQAVNSGSNYPYSANISGLAPNSTYYYRAVVQNQNGIAYGSIVPFSTPGAGTYVPPTRVIVQSKTVTTNQGIVANSQPSLFKLQVNSSYDHMCVGGDIDYTVTYQNISSQDLQNSVLRITFPGELTYASSSQGDYDVTDRTLTISLGTVQAGEQGTVTIHAQVNNQAVAGKLSVITATMVYTNPITHAQEQAIAYSLITISNDCPAVLGASVFGFGGFLPSSLLGWLLLILVILALIVLARSLYRRSEPVKTV